MLCICLCQLFVIRYLFICACYLSCIYFVHCSTIYFIVVCFIPHLFFVLVFKREKNNSDPELVFRYFDPVVPVQVHLHTIINTSQ